MKFSAWMKTFSFLLVLLLTALPAAGGNFFSSPEDIKKLEKELAAAPDIEKSRILNLLSMAYWWHTENPEKIREYAEQALTWARKFNDKKQEAIAWANIGLFHMRDYDYPKATELAQKSLAMAEQERHRDGTLHALTVLSEIHGHIPDYPETLKIYRRIRAIHEEINDIKGIADTTLNIASVLYQDGKTSTALTYYEEALTLFETAGAVDETLNTLLRIGAIHAQFGDNHKALEYFIQVVKAGEARQLNFYVAVAFNRMGKVYEALNDYSNALEYYKKSLALYRKIDDTPGVVALLINIGGVHKALRQYDLALSNLYEAQRLKIRMDNALRLGAADIFLQIGHVFLEKKTYGPAMDYYQKALELGKQFKGQYTEAKSLHYIGRINLARGLRISALEYFRESLGISEKLEDSALTRDNCKRLSDTYAELRKHREALAFYKRYAALKDRIFNETSRKTIAEIQTKYETEKKEQEIELLTKNNQIQKLKINRQRIIRNGIFVVFFLLLIILAQLLRRYRYLLAFWKRKNYIGHYKVIEQLASGGMGIIYKAYDVLDKSRTYAVKVLRDEYFADETQKRRFKNEASIIDSFSHPNIVRIIERGESGGNLYIVMELLEGQSLADAVADAGSLPVDTVLKIMIQVTDALVKVHGKNIIHRDMKPENIMLIKTRKNPYFVKLLDFGLAKTKAYSRLTKTGLILGTIYYLSPEQILDTGVSTASDIYALGIMCCEILTGHKPFEADNEDGVISRILNHRPLEPSRFNPEVPVKLDLLLLDMLAKEPENRPTAPQVLDALKEIRDDEKTK